jgi:hypothetical protein
MRRAPTTVTVGDQITTRLITLGLTTAARELVPRFVQAEQPSAFPLLLEILDLEAQERHERRITRLRRASKLPPGKTFGTLDEGRLPPALRIAATSLCIRLGAGRHLSTSSGRARGHAADAQGADLAGSRRLLAEEHMTPQHPMGLPSACLPVPICEAIEVRGPATAIGALFAVLAVASDAGAELVKYHFEAQGSFVDAWGEGASWPSLLVGGDTDRTIVGSFVVDTALGSSSESRPWYASGYDSVVDFGLRSPALSGRRFASPVSSVSISLDAFDGQGVWDELYLEVPIAGPRRYEFASLHLIDFDGLGFDALYQTGHIDLTAFEIGHILIGSIGDDITHRTVRAELTSLTGTAISLPVPQPSAVCLIVPAVAGLLAWRRRVAS